MTNVLISVVQFVFCTCFFAGLTGILLFAYEEKRPTDSEDRQQFIIKLSFAVGAIVTGIWFLKAFHFI